jgi:hypothetical protein
MANHNVLVVVLLAISLVVFSVLQIEVVRAEPETFVVPDDFSYIQEAIDHATDGDTVYVKSGTYMKFCSHQIIIFDWRKH